MKKKQKGIAWLFVCTLLFSAGASVVQPNASPVYAATDSWANNYMTDNVLGTTSQVRASSTASGNSSLLSPLGSQVTAPPVYQATQSDYLYKMAGVTPTGATTGSSSSGGTAASVPPAYQATKPGYLSQVAAAATGAVLSSDAAQTGPVATSSSSSSSSNSSSNQSSNGDGGTPAEKGSSTNNVGLIEQDKYPGYKVIGAEGFLTDMYVRKVQCSTGSDTKGFYTNSTEGKEKDGGYLVKYIAQMVSYIVDISVDFFFKVDCDKEASQSFTMNIGKELGKLADPVNITNNYIVMKLAGIMQYLAYGLSLVFVMVYGISYMMGKSELGPMKFFMRMGFVLIGIYVVPYLLQDILNLNNVLVYHISQIQVKFDGNSDPANLAVSQAVYDFMKSSSNVIKGNLLLGIVMVAMIIYTLKPLFDIAMWWYTRLLKIFFYAIISPLLVMMMALPKTAKQASKALQDFIGESFSQFFVMIGIAMISMMLANVMDMRYMLELSDVGLMIFMFVALNFMADLPNLAKNITGGLKGGGGVSTAGLAAFAMNFATMKGVKDIAKNTKQMAKNVSGSAKAVNAGVKGTLQAPGKLWDKGKDAVKAVGDAKNTAVHNRTSFGSEKGNRQNYGAWDAIKSKGLAGLGTAAVAGAGMALSKGAQIRDTAPLAGKLSKEVFRKQKARGDAMSEYKAALKDYNDKRYVENELKKENRQGSKDIGKAKYAAMMEQKRQELLQQAKTGNADRNNKGKALNMTAMLEDKRMQEGAKFRYTEAAENAKTSIHNIQTDMVPADAGDKIKQIKRDGGERKRYEEFTKGSQSPKPAQQTTTPKPNGGGHKGGGNKGGGRK